MSAAHQEYYGAAVLSVISPSAAACAGGCAFTNHASQAFITATTNATVSAYDAQIVNTKAVGTGGVYGMRITNGVDNLTTLVTATDALFISARRGSGAGVESWANAIHLRDEVAGADRFFLGNDGTIQTVASVLPMVNGGSNIGSATLRWGSAWAVEIAADAYFVNTGSPVAGVDCPGGITPGTVRVMKGIVTSC
jgi:hypothetical protein